MKINDIVNEGVASGFLRGVGAADTANAADRYSDAQRRNNAQGPDTMSTADTRASIVKNMPSDFMQQFNLIDPDLGIVKYGNTQFQRDDNGKWIDYRTGKPAPGRFIPALDSTSPPAASGAKTPKSNKVSTVPDYSIKRKTVPTSPAVLKPNPARSAPTSSPVAANIPSADTAANTTDTIATLPDGSVKLTDKKGQAWTKSTTAPGWKGPGGVYIQGGADYDALEKVAAELQTQQPKKTSSLIDPKTGQPFVYESIDLAQVLWNKMKSKQ